jgi:hypothetical protein
MTGETEAVLWSVGVIAAVAAIHIFVGNRPLKPPKVSHVQPGPHLNTGPRFVDDPIPYIVLWGLVIGDAACLTFFFFAGIWELIYIFTFAFILFFGLAFYHATTPQKPDRWNGFWF